MRILMISDVYFPRINGVSTSIQTFRRAFQSNGHDVTLIAPDYGQETDAEQDLIRIPSRYVVVDPEDRMMKMGAILTTVDSLRRRWYDILHIQTPFVAHYAGVKLSRRLNIPRVETYHTFFEEYLYNYVPYLPRALLKLAARRFSCAQCNNVDAVAVPSTAMLEVLRSYGVRSRAEVLPTGIENRKFASGDGTAFKRKYRIGPEHPTLVHVGRIAHEKNIDFLLHVMRKLKRSVPDVLLIVAGEGPALNHLRKLAERLDITRNVLFVGYLSRDKELLDCYAAGDVFVFSSRTETQGLVVLEAMALGVPVVSIEEMGTRDILRANKGALVADHNVQDFAAKTRRLLLDSGLRARLQSEGRTHAKDWSTEALAARMLDFYQETIDRYRSSGSQTTP